MDLRFNLEYNVPGVMLTKLTSTNNRDIHRLQVLNNLK